MSRWGGARTALLLGLLALTGCQDLLLPPRPDDDPVEVARAAWSEFDAYYPFFVEKGIDWEAVGEELLPRVGPETTNGELFVVLRKMVDALRDGHAQLRTPSVTYAWRGWYTDRPANFREEIIPAYLRSPTGTASRGALWYGTLDGGIGYLRFSTFAPHSNLGDAVDLALAELGPVPALVIDLRDNGGGSNVETEAVAGRFLSSRVHYRTHRYKSGPGHQDFGPEFKDFITPTGREHFYGPIVVLQNRKTYSAAEDFILALRVRNQVTFVGDTTGGGTGNPIGRELPNGWFLRVSRWQAWGADGTWYEGVGLAPDLHQDVSPEELNDGRDTILERAMDHLLEPQSPEGAPAGRPRSGPEQ